MFKEKKKIALVLAALTTVVLGGVAVVTAIRLYRKGGEPVAPTAPIPVPAAEKQCTVTFTVEDLPTRIFCDGASFSEQLNRTVYGVGNEFIFQPSLTAYNAKFTDEVYIKIGEAGTTTPVLSFQTTACNGLSTCTVDITVKIPNTTAAKSLLGEQVQVWVVAKAIDNQGQTISCSDIQNRTGAVAGYPFCGKPPCLMNLTQPDVPTPTPPKITPTPTLPPGVTPTPTLPPGVTPTPTLPPGVTPTPTTVAQIELPEAGFTLPTIGAIFAGLVLIITSLLFIL